jgi:hypothetical protein
MGTGSSKDEVAYESLTDSLLRHSGKSYSKDPDLITLEGVRAYIKSDQAAGNMHFVPIGKKVEEYRMIDSLTKISGMSGQRKYELCSEAYSRLNNTGHLLSDAGIERPKSPQSIASSSAPSNTNTVSKLPPGTAQELDALLSNPHSFLALSGRKRESFEDCDPSKLNAAIVADKAFLVEGAGYWTLAPQDRQTVATGWASHLNTSNVLETGLVGATNQTPLHAITGAKTELVNAIQGGYDIRSEGALSAFAKAAAGVNLAINSTNTLAGRGTDSISEQTMLYSPDGHNNRGAMLPK